MQKRKIFLWLLLIVLGIVFLKTGPIVYRGYAMYLDAVGECSISDKVLSIRSKPNFTRLEDVSDVFLELLVASEDHRFYEHKGISLVATGRALKRNIKAGSKVEGGSSITQQLAKNMFFSFEKQYERKVAELFVVYQLEKTLSKDEILELYCNIAYLGEGTYGVYEASYHYYGIHPRALDFDQATLLVKTLKSPSLFNPNVAP